MNELEKAVRAVLEVCMEKMVPVDEDDPSSPITSADDLFPGDVVDALRPWAPELVAEAEEKCRRDHRES